MRPLLIHASSKISGAGGRRRVVRIEYSESPLLGEGIELATA